MPIHLPPAKTARTAAQWLSSAAIAAGLLAAGVTPVLAQTAAAPAPSWQQGRTAEQNSSTLHPIAPIFTGRPAADLPLKAL